MFWFRGGSLLYVLNINVDGEYGYNVFNILGEVDDILLETDSWLKVDKSFLGKKKKKKKNKGETFHRSSLL